MEDFSKDVKRIQKSLELDDLSMVPGDDLFGMIDVMMLCAGHPLSEGMPADTKFLYALQRVHDWHHDRVVPTDEEWQRVSKILMIARPRGFGRDRRGAKSRLAAQATQEPRRVASL